MEGKAGLHPGGRAGGLRAPGAGGSNPSPLVRGAAVRAGGADPRLLLGGSGVFPRDKSGSPGGRPREALSTLVLTPPPGGLAPAPRPRPPGPPSHPRARCSAGGGIGWGRGAEAAAGTTSLPAASLCARGASGGGERASERRPSAAGRASAPGRVRGGARGCAAPASRQLYPSAPRRARSPATAGVPPPAVAGRGLVGTGVPTRGPGHPGAAERCGAPRGAPVARQRPPAELRGHAGAGAQGRPEGRAPRLLRGSPYPVERTARARPSRTGPCAHPPRTPLLHKLF